MNHDALAAWLDAYKRAWEGRDPDQVVGIFTEDAIYAETPFAAPAVGHDGIRRYWENATGPQRDVSFGYDIISADPAVVHWTAGFALPAHGNRGQLDGVFHLEFAADGRCSRLREWWFFREV